MDTNTESAGRYHSNWLSMMQSRLLLARNLLKDDGVIFVSIDDNEMHNLRKLMDDVFGEENFVAIFPWRKRTAKSDVPFGISQDFEWIVCYAKNQFVGSISHVRNYYQTDDFPNDRWRLSDLTKQTSADERPNSAFDLIDPKTKKAYSFNPKRTWAITRDTFNEYYKKGKIVFPDDYNFLKITIPAYRVFESEDKAKAFKKFGTEDMFKAVSTLLPKEAGMSEDGNKEVGKLFNEKVFSFPKPIGLLKYLTEIATSNDDLILDFFAGSGTTAHAVMELNKQDGGNRKFILVQLPEETDVTSEASKAGYKIISDITIERVKRAGKKIKAEKSDIDVGFKVYRLSKSLFPHNLFEVDPEMTEEQKTKAWEVYLEKAKQAHIFDYKLDELLVEVALKDGFDLNFKSEPIKEFKKNKVLKISDEDKTAIICLDETIHEDTVKGLEVYKDQRLICLERAVDTTSKWNLRRMFGENLWVA
jgi:adenine-specific DNA-methyltransferase